MHRYADVPVRHRIGLALLLWLFSTGAHAAGLVAQLLSYRSEVLYLLAQHIKLVAMVALLSVALGVASQVPGGLGVFEAALMTIWAARIGPGLPVALVAYRLIYNLLPCALSVLSLAAWEVAGAGKASV